MPRKHIELIPKAGTRGFGGPQGDCKSTLVYINPMPISPDLIGTHHRYPSTYVVEREKIRELSLAIQNHHPAHHTLSAANALGHHQLVIPPTFLCILGYRAQKWFLQHSGITINDKKIAQVDQQFTMLRPIIAGDVLHCEVHMHDIRTAFGADIVTTKNVITTDDGTAVQLGYTTLMGQTGDQPGFTQFTSESVSAV